MVRISGVDLADKNIVQYALTVLYGVGSRNARSILDKAHVDYAKRVKDLSEQEVMRIQQVIDKDTIVEGDLRRIVNENIKRLKVIGAYRGVRHTKGLPVRGQRTRSNARTRRGKRKTVGALKKEDRAKIQTPLTGAKAS